MSLRFFPVAIRPRAALATLLLSTMLPVWQPIDGHQEGGGRDGSGRGGAQEQGTEPEAPKPRPGIELGRRPGGDLAPGSPGRRPRLSLPSGGARPDRDSRRTAPGADSAGGADRRPAAGLKAPAQPLALATSDAAAAVFEELQRASNPQGSLLAKAEESLLAMGEEGLAAARIQLFSSEEPCLVTAARVLLKAGDGEDHDLVLTRMGSKLPSGAAPSLLRALVERDPVRASPEFLVSLLDHPTSMMRTSAERELKGRLDPTLLPHLARALNARRVDTRMRALGLVNGIEGPGVLLLLASRLGDGSSKVALRAAESLAARADDEVIELLRGRALGGGSAWEAGRDGAYALLALVLIEDREGRVLLDDSDVPRLLEGLGTDRALTAAASAIALAGVGFRSPRSRDYTWLDLEVPHVLIRWGSGAEFHPDFSSVNELALRRMGLLSGEPLGLDGLAWRRWWTENAGHFRARRAVVPVSRLEAAALALILQDGFLPPDALALLGPAATSERAADVDRVFYLDLDRCEALFDLLEREGVFGAQRLPAGTGTFRDRRLLDVRFGAQGKLLEEPEGEGGAWFQRLVSTLESLESDNLWQRWFDPLRYNSQREFWEAERERFSTDSDTPERKRAEVELLLARLEAFFSTSLVDEREEEVLAALGERYALPGIARPEDYPRLRKLLAAENFHGQRAADLLGLALLAGRQGARADDGTGMANKEGLQGSNPLDPTLAQDLLGILSAQEGPRVSEALGRVVAAGGLEAVRFAARSPHAGLRAIAAQTLPSLLTAGGSPVGDSSNPQRALLEGLLADPEPEVEAAACRAVAQAGLGELAAALLVRAQLGSPGVRAAALEGLVTLKNPEAFELLRQALFAPDLDLQRTAAQGLADLADPAAAPLLARLMARGSSSPLFKVALKGLGQLGPAATDELLVLANSGADDVRREAALLLSALGVADALPLLLTSLTIHREDSRVAAELAILSCVDFRASEDPVSAWWSWWDLVVQDNSRAWIAAAAEVARRPAPGLEALAGDVSLEGALFFLSLLTDDRPHVVERVRRELSLILGRELVLEENELDLARQRAQLERELRSLRTPK